MTIEEWAKDFKSFVNELQMPRDDYKGIMGYIDDAIALMKKQDAREKCLKTKCVVCPHCDNCDVDENGLLKAQEAKQGKWEREYSRPGVYANLFWWCSVCGEPTRYNDAGIFYQYCPHCGAKLEPCIET